MQSVLRTRFSMCKDTNDLLKFTNEELEQLKEEARFDISVANCAIEAFDAVLAYKATLTKKE